MPEEENEVLTPEEESLRALEAMDRPSPLTDRSNDAAAAETTDACLLYTSQASRGQTDELLPDEAVHRRRRTFSHR